MEDKFKSPIGVGDFIVKAVQQGTLRVYEVIEHQGKIKAVWWHLTVVNGTKMYVPSKPVTISRWNDSIKIDRSNLPF